MEIKLQSLEEIFDMIRQSKINLDLTLEEVRSMWVIGFNAAVSLNDSIGERYEQRYASHEPINKLFSTIIDHKDVVDCEECTNCLSQQVIIQVWLPR